MWSSRSLSLKLCRHHYLAWPPPGPQADVGFGGPPLTHHGHSHSPSYTHQVSDLRTGSATSNKRKHAGSNSALSTSPSVHSEAAVNINADGVGQCFFDALVRDRTPPQDVCADCVDCDDADCQGMTTDKCTDQRVVIPGSDESHGTCTSVCTEEPCRVENCDGEISAWVLSMIR